MLERHAPEKDIFVRDVLEYFSVSDSSEWRKTNTWQQRDGIAFRRAGSRQQLSHLAKWNNWEALVRGKLLDVNFFWQTRQTLACVRPFFFPRNKWYAAAPGGESERSGHHAAVSHPEKRLDGLLDKALHAAPKTVAHRSTPRLCASHSRPSSIPAIVGIRTCGFLQYLVDVSTFLTRLIQAHPLSAGLEAVLHKRTSAMFTSKKHFLFCLFFVLFLSKNNRGSRGRSDAHPERDICFLITPF